MYSYNRAISKVKTRELSRSEQLAVNQHNNSQGIRCPQCMKTQQGMTAKFCPFCGTKLQTTASKSFVESFGENTNKGSNTATNRYPRKEKLDDDDDYKAVTLSLSSDILEGIEKTLRDEEQRNVQTFINSQTMYTAEALEIANATHLEEFYQKPLYEKLIPDSTIATTNRTKSGKLRRSRTNPGLRSDDGQGSKSFGPPDTSTESFASKEKPSKGRTTVENANENCLWSNSKGPGRRRKDTDLLKDGVYETMKVGYLDEVEPVTVYYQKLMERERELRGFRRVVLPEDNNNNNNDESIFNRSNNVSSPDDIQDVLGLDRIHSRGYSSGDVTSKTENIDENIHTTNTYDIELPTSNNNTSSIVSSEDPNACWFWGDNIEYSNTIRTRETMEREQSMEKLLHETKQLKQLFDEAAERKKKNQRVFQFGTNNTSNSDLKQIEENDKEMFDLIEYDKQYIENKESESQGIAILWTKSSEFDNDDLSVAEDDKALEAIQEQVDEANEEEEAKIRENISLLFVLDEIPTLKEAVQRVFEMREKELFEYFDQSLKITAEDNEEQTDPQQNTDNDDSDGSDIVDYDEDDEYLLMPFPSTDKDKSLKKAKNKKKAKQSLKYKVKFYSIMTRVYRFSIKKMKESQAYCDFRFVEDPISQKDVLQTFQSKLQHIATNIQHAIICDKIIKVIYNKFISFCNYMRSYVATLVSEKLSEIAHVNHAFKEHYDKTMEHYNNHSAQHIEHTKKHFQEKLDKLSQELKVLQYREERIVMRLGSEEALCVAEVREMRPRHAKTIMACRISQTRCTGVWKHSAARIIQKNARKRFLMYYRNSKKRMARRRILGLPEVLKF